MSCCCDTKPQLVIVQWTRRTTSRTNTCNAKSLDDYQAHLHISSGTLNVPKVESVCSWHYKGCLQSTRNRAHSENILRDKHTKHIEEVYTRLSLYKKVLCLSLSPQCCRAVALSVLEARLDLSKSSCWILSNTWVYSKNCCQQASLARM